jgi:predicted ATPase
MLINKIRISNFKNFDTIEIELGKMNVLVGANASGKSNFLDVIQFINDIQEFGLEDAISLRGGIEYLRNVNLVNNNVIELDIEFNSFKTLKKGDLSYKNIFVIKKFYYSLKIEIVENGLYRILFEEITEKVSINDNNKNILEYVFHLLYKKDGSVELMRDINHYEDTKYKKLMEYFENPLNISQLSYIYISSYRGGIIKKESIKTFIEKDGYFAHSTLSHLYDFDIKKAKLGSPIIGKQVLEKNGENLPIVLKKILSDEDKARRLSNILSDILPFVEKINVDKFYDKSLLFSLKEKTSTHSIFPSSFLSDGTISVVLIMIALFFENHKLVMFEEPEHGIHPALIAKLMQYFYEASENKQIIITTHNPEILKNTKLEDIILISRGENGSANVSKPSEKEMVKTFLQNELGIDVLFVQNLLDV